jgi:hypothetical protein
MTKDNVRSFEILKIVCEFAGYTLEMYSDGLAVHPSVELKSVGAIPQFASSITCEADVAGEDPYAVAWLLRRVRVQMENGAVLIVFTDLRWVD